MHHEITFNQDCNYILIRTYGLTTLEGVLAFIRDLIDHPQFKPGRNIVQDHREVQASALSSDDIRSIASFTQQHREELGNGKCALVMRATADFGMARMWESYADGHISLITRTFLSFSDAEQWINKTGNDQ